MRARVTTLCKAECIIYSILYCRCELSLCVQSREAKYLCLARTMGQEKLIHKQNLTWQWKYICIWMCVRACSRARARTRLCMCSIMVVISCSLTAIIYFFLCRGPRVFRCDPQNAPAEFTCIQQLSTALGTADSQRPLPIWMLAAFPDRWVRLQTYCEHVKNKEINLFYK